jgi:Polysaccharide pyruvyl transferase.
MRKVALVTCFLDNCGACLQAYALQSSIQKFGLTCEIIKYIGPDGYDHRTLPRRIISGLAKNRFTFGFLSLFSSKIKGKYYIKTKSLKFDRFRRKQLCFTKKRYFSFDELDSAVLDYDGFVAGSDQIWNPTFYNGNNRVYFLDFVKESKPRIAYAPSIGITAIPKEYEDDFRTLVNKFDYLSVREQKGVEIISKYSDRECRLVLDPTLLLTGDEWIKRFKTHNKKRKYILLYLFGEREYYQNFINCVTAKLGLEIVCIPFTEKDSQNSKYRRVFDAGPIDFLSLVSNASLVITDSFHATVFSILFGTPFYTLLRGDPSDPKNMNERIFSLLNIVELTDRIVSKFNSSFSFSTEMDFSIAQAKIAELRRSSIAYLKEALGENDKD